MTLSRRGIMGMFGGGVATIASGGLPQQANGGGLVPTAAAYYGAEKVNSIDEVPEHIRAARHLTDTLMYSDDVPSVSLADFRDNDGHRGIIDSELASMKSLSASSRERILAERHLAIRRRSVIERRRRRIEDRAGPLLSLGVITRADVEKMISGDFDIEKIRRFAYG